MSGVIFFGDDHKTILAMEREVGQLARVKSTSDVEVCQAWIRSQNPAVIVVGEAKRSASAIKIAAFAWATGFAGTLICSKSADNFDHELVVAGFAIVDAGKLVEVTKKVLSENKQKSPVRPKCLIVEDLDVPRDVICAFVERFGYEVVGVASAAEAMQRLIAAPAEFNCVITDINMPKVKGTQLIAQIRATERLSKLPVVVLTAYGTGECLVESLEAGASGFLVKPPRREDMQRELARAGLILKGLESPRLVSRLDIDRLKESL